MKTLIVLGILAISASVLAVDCPDEDEDSHATYYPHELECGKFYECRNGEAIILECPPGLYWDARLNVCNWDVNCGELWTSTAPPPTTSTTEPPEPTTEATEPPPPTEEE